MFKALLFLLFVQFSMLTSAFAGEHDYISERAYIEDKTNALSLSDVQKLTPITFNGLFSKGYSSSAFWVRLKIEPFIQSSAKPEQKLVLRIQPTYLDEILLYDPAQTPALLGIVGDRYPLANNGYQTISYNLFLPNAEAPRYVWLRLKTTSTNMLQVSALTLADAEFEDRSLGIFSIAVLSMIFVFVVWALLYWALFKERLIGIFIFRQIVGALYLFAYVGFFRVLLADEFPAAELDRLTSLLVLFATTSAVWFHREFFRDYLLRRWIWHCFNFVLLLLPLELLLALNGRLSLALEINMWVVLVLPVFMLAVSIFGVQWSQLAKQVSVLPRSALIAFHAMFFVLTALSALPSLALMTGGVFSPHSILLHGLATSFVVLVMLLYRSKRLEQSRILNVALAQQEAANEKKIRQEQGDFLTMLTHEFRTSLAVVRMTLAGLPAGSKEALYADLAIENMNDVIERCAQVQALADKQVQLQIDALNLKGVLANLIAASRAPDRIKLNCASLLMVRSDEKLLKVLISNLIDNAIKYSPPASVVEINVRHLDQDTKVIISNSVGSAGMPDAEMVFEKYYRAPKAHEHVGSGLGLYLCAQLAKMMGVRLRYLPEAKKVNFELCLN